MLLSQTQQANLRQWVKDEQSYQQMIDFLNETAIQKQLMEHLSVATMVVDIQDQYKIIYVNQAFEALTGYSMDDLIGQHPSILYGDELEQLVLETLHDTIHKGEKLSLTARNYRKNGMLFYNQINAFPLLDDANKPMYYVSTHKEVAIDDHRAIQESLTLTGHNPDPIYRKNRDGIFLYTNSAFAKIFNREPEDIIGKRNADIGVEGDLLTFFKNARHTVFETGETQEIEFSYTTKEGQRIFRSRITPEFDLIGQVETILVVSRDVTNEVQAQQALTEKEELLRKAEHVARIGSWERNLDTGQVMWSDSFYDICGLDPETTTPSLALRKSLIHPEDQAKTDPIIDEAIDNNSAYQVEKRIIRPDGEIRWIDSRGEVAIDELTGTRKLIGTFRDITERKQTELLLQASEQRATALLNAMPDVVFRIDKNGKYLDFHGDSQFLVDRDGNVAGKTIYDRLDRPIALEIHYAITQALQTGEMQRLEQEIWFPLDKSARIFEARIIPSGLEEVISVLRDVTEDKQQEREIQRQEAQYRSVLSGMLEGVFLYDETGAIIMCNDAACDITGRTREQLLQPLPDQPVMNLLNEQDELFTYETFPAQITLRTKQAQDNVIMKFIHPKTQDMRWLKVNTRPLLDARTDTLYGVVSTFADITEERLAEIERVNTAIERERIAVLNSFIQMSSHEFRTPLAVIMTNLHMIERFSESENVHKRLDRINQQVNRLNNLIDMQLLMTKLDSGVILQTKNLNLTTLISQQVSVLSERLESSQIDIRLDIAPDAKIIYADSFYLTEALQQILENAIRYTQVGGQVIVQATQTSTHTQISIQDTGVGISEEDLPFVFDRFWRRDKAHTVSGFGLGLALAKQILALHKGDISIDSTPNQGTLVTLSLPIMDE
ncbi:MAG: PAS domain S-box protein [Chloroflexota bacterium]